MNRLAYDNDLSEDGVYPAEVVEWDLAGRRLVYHTAFKSYKLP